MTPNLTRAEGAKGPANAEFAPYIQKCIDRCERELRSGSREGAVQDMSPMEREMVEIQHGLHLAALAGTQAPPTRAVTAPADLFNTEKG